jgi:predicted metal-dependent phosphoesterase TrpH
MTNVYADLHTHSSASDGDLEPEALVDAACEAGLELIALTDHDTVAGLERAVARGKERGVEVLEGCELTAYVGRIELHLLAYFFGVERGPLHELIDAVVQYRRERALQMGRQLNAAGYTITDEDILHVGRHAHALGQPHVAEALVRRGHVRERLDAFRLFLNEGKIGYVPKKNLTPADVIKAVHASCGIVSLAHPGLTPHDELFASLCGQGLDAIEAIYPAHHEMNRRFYSGMARRYEKGVSGGSDFHGPKMRPDIQLGAAGVNKAQLADLRRRARSRRSAASG